MARPDRRSLGFDAEQRATRHLASHGATLLHRNFRCRIGEIDIIAKDDQCLVFVEVRYRGSSSYSRAGLTVDIHKQRKLIRTAALYIAKRPQFSESVVRFDVIAIDADKRGEVSIEWIKDAFRPSDSAL